MRLRLDDGQPRSAWARALAVGAAVLVTIAPGTARAHDISGATPDRQVWEFVPLGVQHMLLGWDHLLFIAGVVLIAGEWRRSAKLISAFAAGHSATLIIATLGRWRIDPRLVDIMIAASVVFVAAIGLIGASPPGWLFAITIFEFGLAHGVGLSTRLQDLGLPQNGLLARVLTFNVGIELGQLAVVAGLLILGRVFMRLTRWPQARYVAYGAMAAAGLLAAVQLSVSVIRNPDPAGAGADVAKCAVYPRLEVYPGDGGRPPKNFFGPEETAPMADFGHVLGDGYIVVQYWAALPADQVGQLRTLVADGGGRIVAGVAPDQSVPVKAVNSYHTLTCGEFDLAAIQRFVNYWFNDPRSRIPESPGQ